jgi:hypothetical protein
MPLSVSTFAVNADGTISFTIADAYGEVTLLPPFVTAFTGAPLANGPNTLTPEAQDPALSGTLQVNDESGGDPVDVVRLYLGTDGIDTYSDVGTTPVSIFSFGYDDSLSGGSANDWILGGLGADDLRGEGGDDTYV